MDNHKVIVAVAETVGATTIPYIIAKTEVIPYISYVEGVTPIFTLLSVIIGTVYITIKAYKEIKNK